MNQAADFDQDDALGDELNASAFSGESTKPKTKGKLPPWLLNSVLMGVVALVIGLTLWNMFGKRLLGGAQSTSPTQMMQSDALQQPRPTPQQTRPGPQQPQTAQLAAPSVMTQQQEAPMRSMIQPSVQSAMVPGPTAVGMQTAAQQVPMMPVAGDAVEKLGVETTAKLVALQARMDGMLAVLTKVQAQVEASATLTAQMQGEAKAQADLRQAAVMAELQKVIDSVNTLSEEIPKKPGVKPAIAKSEKKPAETKKDEKAAGKADSKPQPKTDAKLADKSKPAVATAKPIVSLRGILDDRAMLQLRNGESISVSIGDALPGSSVTISKIDADRGELTLSDGTVLK